MRVSPILISNSGVMSLKKTPNIKNCYIQEEPTKPECAECSFKSKAGGATLTGAILGLPGGFFTVAIGAGIGKLVDNWLNKPHPTDDLPEQVNEPDYYGMRDVVR